MLPTRTALVAGATCAVGAAVATLLAEDGYRVIVADPDLDSARQVVADLPGRGHRGLTLDLDDPLSIEAVIGSLTGLDVLICDTGACVDRAGASLAADPQAGHRNLQPDPYGPWRLAKAAVPLLLRSSRPRLVLVAGDADAPGGATAGVELRGDAGGFKRRGRLAAGYETSRAALHALTTTLAGQLADTPVLVNAVCPEPAAFHGAGLGVSSVADAANSVLWAARLPDDGPRGGLFRDGEPVPW